MFHTIFYEPIYNLLVLALTYAPLHDIGTAVIVVTLIVKFVLLPLQLSAVRSGYIMKKLEGEMKKIREMQKTKPQEASKQMVELYRREKINPFAGFFALLIQIPVVIALYQVFSKGLVADPASLYSFLSFPDNLHTLAFGLFDVTEKSIPVAILAGIAAYFLARRQTATMVVEKESKDETFQDHFMKSMRIQLLYILPVATAFFAAILPSAIGLYFFVSSVVGYVQDVYIKRKLAHLHQI